MEFDKIKHAVNSIEMSETMKNRIKENCLTLETKRSARLNFKSWILVACSAGILLLIMLGTPFINMNGSFQVANFTITAFALSDDGSQMSTDLSSEKAILKLSTEDRIERITSTSGGGAGFIFTDVMLNITGKDIDSITYNINKGKFIEDVTLTAKERADKEHLLLEKIYIIYGEDGSDVYQGIKEIGNTYTVRYAEQDQYQYTLAIPHDGNGVVADDIKVEVIINYTNGKSEQQDIVVTQEASGISLTLN